MRRKNPKSQVPVSTRRRRFRYLSLVLPVLALLLLPGCDDNTPAPWPWWTAADSAAVASELTAWRDSISTRSLIEGQAEDLLDSVPTLLARDSTSTTGEDRVKVRRLLGFGLQPGSLMRRDSMLFGVTVDSLTSDTTSGDSFCHVIAADSALDGTCVTRYNSYWVIHYRADTTVNGPDTTISFKLDPANPPQLVDEEKESQKAALTKTYRYAWLKKNGGVFNLKRMSGFSLYLPSTSNAPTLRYLILNRQGVTDSFLLNAQRNQHGIYNLRHIDSLYTVRKGEPISVQVVADVPKLDGDLFYFLARIGNRRTLLTRGTSMPAGREVTFNDVGLQHLIVEVIPQSNLFYPGSEFTGAFWSMPIRVIE